MELPDVPHLLRDVPHLLRDVPHLLRDVPHLLRDVPHLLRDVPHLLRDVYPKILSRLTPKNILAFCTIDKYHYDLYCDNNFWKQIVIARWGLEGIEMALDFEAFIFNEAEFEYFDDRVIFNENEARRELYIQQQDPSLDFKHFYKEMYHNDLLLLGYYIEIDNRLKINQILARGIDLNKFDRDHEYSALMNAITENNLEIFRMFLQSDGIDVNVRNNSGRTALSTAIVNENKEIFDELLKIDHIDLNNKTDIGSTMLMLACAGSNLEIVREILRRDYGDINARNNYNQTALMFSFRNKKLISYKNYYQ